MGSQAFRAKQIWDGSMRMLGASYDAMTNLLLSSLAIFGRALSLAGLFTQEFDLLSQSMLDAQNPALPCSDGAQNRNGVDGVRNAQQQCAFLRRRLRHGLHLLRQRVRAAFKRNLTGGRDRGTGAVFERELRKLDPQSPDHRLTNLVLMAWVRPFANYNCACSVRSIVE